MNIVHGKKANSVVLASDSHLDVIPTPSKLTADQKFARYIRRGRTYTMMLTNKKGVK
jgi:hypothetical protein